MRTILSLIGSLALAAAAAAQATAVRARAGTTGYTDAAGAKWAPDTGLFTGASALSGCAPGATVGGTPDPGLYKAARYGSSAANELQYTFAALRPGAYTVSLYFAETCAGMLTGYRVFSVQAQGATVLSNFDIYQAAGGANRAVVKTFPTVVGADGKLTVKFIHQTNNPIVYALAAVLNADTTPPVVTITSPAPGTTAAALPLAATIVDDTGVAQVAASVDGTATPVVSAAGSTYTFAADVTKLPLGAHVAQVAATDAAGNTGTAMLSFATAIAVTLAAAPAPHKVTLTWAAPSPVPAGTVTYNMYRSTTSGAYGAPLATTATLIYVDQAVAAGQTYYYRVTATAGGVESGPSNEVAVTVPAP